MSSSCCWCAGQAQRSDLQQRLFILPGQLGFHTSSSSRPQYTRGSGRFSSRSSVSSRRSILGSSELVTRPTMRMRNEATLVGLAVALRFPPLLIDPTTVTRKTSPLFRCTSQDILENEARDAQQEEAIRRTTRSRRSSLMRSVRPSLQPRPTCVVSAAALLHRIFLLFQVSGSLSRSIRFHCSMCRPAKPSYEGELRLSIDMTSSPEGGMVEFFRKSVRIAMPFRAPALDCVGMHSHTV